MDMEKKRAFVGLKLSEGLRSRINTEATNEARTLSAMTRLLVEEALEARMSRRAKVGDRE